MIFNDKFNRTYNSAILIEDQRVTRVNSFKYLGCFLTENMCDADDIERSMRSFNKSFGFLFRKFYSLDIEPFYFSLFLIYCTSFYGSELWVGRTRLGWPILGWPKFVSNHLVCNIFNTVTFEYFMNHKSLNFLLWLKRNNSTCFIRFKGHFFRSITFKQDIDDIFLKKYDLSNVLDNDFDAILSRIYFVFNREPSSMYVPFYF